MMDEMAPVTDNRLGKLALIAAGGTGGHMFPAQSLAEHLLSEGWRVSLSTDERGARYAGGFPPEVTREVVASASTSRGGVKGKLVAPFKIAAGVYAALRQMRRDRPAVVIGFGGYPSIPALAAATLLRIPRIIHEQNGVMGRVNLLFAPTVDRVACGTWPTVLPKGVEAVHTGNPVRASILQVVDEPYQPPANGGLNILVIGGSQGSHILSVNVAEAIRILPETIRGKIRVSHQVRPEDLEAVRAIYEAEGIKAQAESFFDDIPTRLAAAQLVVARAGASSIAEITATGRPSILVPFAAAAGDHQTANAQVLADAGAAIMLKEAGFDTPTLAAAVTSVLTDPEKAGAMAGKSRLLGRQDASLRLYDIVKEVMK